MKIRTGTPVLVVALALPVAPALAPGGSVDPRIGPAATSASVTALGDNPGGQGRNYSSMA